ncbi:Uncharacterised protein [Mycobacteroides abscessus subsp. abscessus]|nr:Uncharacterised protein [Mycobacteroides abscessus subsp. abscessus]SIN17657.1 Uncharacterised protein [Mycobacteroides abscessus subsp. abscessus]
MVARLEFGYLGAYLGDDTGDLMTRDDGVVGASPLVADGVDIGVTDTGELDVDEDIVWTDLTTLDRGGNQGVLTGCRGISRHGDHICILLR